MTSRKIPTVLTQREVECLLQSVRTDTLLGRRDKALLELAYATGMRVSELVNVKVGQLSPDRTLRVIGKGDKERIVVVGKQARNSIAAYLALSRSKLDTKGKARDRLLLGQHGGPLTTAGVGLIVKRCARRAGLTKTISPHTLRHSFATHLLEGGAQLDVIQKLLGHACLSTTGMYLHMTVKHLKASAALHPRATTPPKVQRQMPADLIPHPWSYKNQKARQATTDLAPD